ncbi:Dihydropyrimidine dehydrogenase (NADP(+)) [Citrus sinensis]|nr:Dihydropyrimidine dehydrogenase (NADP(+)) [Citrus sinensis]
MASLNLNQIISNSNTSFAVNRRPGLRLPSRIGLRVLASDSASAEPDLSITVNGLQMPNPFVIGSGPPGTNYTVMKRAFDEGWGAVVAKTVSLDAAKVINVTPRYARLRAGANGSAKGQIIGWENIELISDRPLETMLKEFKQLKALYPDKILIASIMEEYNKAAWEELIDRVEETGIDAIEVNFSCPHGMPERKMGAAVGQDCRLLEEVCGWINAKATVPVWAKMTPNITDITEPARVALRSGSEGVSAINTIMSVMGIDLKTLRPEPCVEGFAFSDSVIFHPIALGKVMSIAKMMKSEFNDKDYSLSGIGGVETGGDAAEFILLGANTVQVCTGVMMHGYGLVKRLCEELKDFMKMHNFSSIEDFRGASIEYFTTHTELVRMQQEAIQQRKAVRKGLQSDKDWTGKMSLATYKTVRHHRYHNSSSVISLEGSMQFERVTMMGQMFQPYTDVLRLFSISNSPSSYDFFKTRFLPFCPENHSQFSHPSPLWKNKDFFIKLPFKLNEDINPTKATYPGMTPSNLKLAQQECSQLLQQGLIEPTNSDWACQAFYVEKRSEKVRGKKCLVIDYQPLNYFLRDDKFPLPKIQSLFVHILDAKVFSKFDFKVGFWQLGIHPVDRHKTAFCIPNGHYQWKVMSFGLKVAPSLFQKAMIKIFEPIL